MKEVKINYPIYFDKVNSNGIIYDKDSYIKALSKKTEYPLIASDEPGSRIMDLKDVKSVSENQIGIVKEVNIDENYAIIQYNDDIEIPNIDDICLSGNLTGRIFGDTVILEDILYFYISAKKDTCW